MLGTPHLLGADVPPLGAILLTYSGSGTSPSATRDYQYIFRALGADVPPLGATLVAQSRRTAIGDCQYVSRAPGAAMPLR